MTRTRQERFRLGSLVVLVCLFFAVAVGRLVHLQVWKHTEYAKKVTDQTSGRVTIPAERGRIYDRRGSIVADNVSVSSLYAYPIDSRQLLNISTYLERSYALKPGRAQRSFKLAVDRFRWIERRLSDKWAGAIEANAPCGLYLRKETQRIYPYSPIGQQVLGFTSIDHIGLAGVELAYDSILAGSEGSADIRRDGLRNIFRVKEQALLQPEPGLSLVLSVDWLVQEIVERELQLGVREHGAKSGMAVFLDCHNGDILAIAHYDPEEQTADKPVKLRAVTDQFEPGSVFKAITATVLLEAGIIGPDDSIFCEQGKWKVGKRIIRDDKKHGMLTFAQVIELSSNIGVGKCAIELGGERLCEAARCFGLGQSPGTGLPGEICGSIAQPAHWSDFAVASLAMGHAIAVTPLQLAVAFAALGNGGTLVRPTLVLGRVGDDGFVPNPKRGEVLGQVMCAASAAIVHQLLLGVVERGTAEAVRSPYVSIAGKTGTAEIPDPIHGGYIKNKFVASFGGYFPAERPVVAGIVVLLEPEPVHYGGWTAGPVFRHIAERWLVARPDMIPTEPRAPTRDFDRHAGTTEVPDLLGWDMASARAMAGEMDLKLRTNSDEGCIIWQYPSARGLTFAQNEVLACTESEGSAGLTMVDLRGLPIRQAAAFLRFAGITCRVVGNGRVVKQSIRPGEVITENMHCRLDCRPQ